MIDTAVHIGGAFGGYLFAFAGILATLSSINTAVMASSRTSFAMARDQRLPSLFKAINRTTKTPVFSIVMSSIIPMFFMCNVVNVVIFFEFYV